MHSSQPSPESVKAKSHAGTSLQTAKYKTKGEFNAEIAPW